MRKDSRVEARSLPAATGFVAKIAPQDDTRIRSAKFGSGAWTRTRITSSKGWRATNCTTPEMRLQNYKLRRKPELMVRAAAVAPEIPRQKVRNSQITLRP